MKEMPTEFKVYKTTSEEILPLFVFHHGGGHTGESFNLLSRKLHGLLPCNTLAFDCRGHGQTKSSNDADLSLETLTDDFAQVIELHRGNAKEIIIVGHSMGAAVAVELVSRGVKGCIGCVVVDVVEGTALEALSHMNSIINARPTQFNTTDEAVEWAISHRQIRNRESARISIPSQLIESNGIFKWRTDLKASSQYWDGWFKGLSEKFLKMRGARLLVLAGTDRLDQTLIIGQMQGVFH